MKYWITVQVPVEAQNVQDAMDMGWEKLIDPDGPPEGLCEHVTLERPEIAGCLIVAAPEGQGGWTETCQDHTKAA